MLTAETAVFLQLKLFRCVLLVLSGVIVPLLALVAAENYLDPVFCSHFSAPPNKLPPCFGLAVAGVGLKKHTKINLSADR